jgi:hypothetical protein
MKISRHTFGCTTLAFAKAMAAVPFDVKEVNQRHFVTL